MKASILSSIFLKENLSRIFECFLTGRLIHNITENKQYHLNYTNIPEKFD